MSPFRKLTSDEISALTMQGCRCDNWDLILVSEGFTPENIFGSTFSGHIKIGVFVEKAEFPGGVKKQSGIYNSVIHESEIGDNTYISHIKNYIANYRIGNNVVIENSELICVTGATTFGNGTRVDVLDETGGRQIPIYDHLSSHIAYILTFYRHHPELIQKLESMVQRFSEDKKSETGYIGNYSRIINCKQITNTFIGDGAKMNGVNRLHEGSVNSTADAPIVVGSGVVADHFIISSGSEVSDGAVLTNCFVGQGCTLGKHYSAIHSLFFANCQGFNGEACSVFAGPYTVTHHKSTLLIAGMFSFLNAGSGSNQSNHMYKLGPIHHGVVDRGSKTTSDSYLLWPARVGPFTLVMGRHYKNADTSDMPFSYLIENKDESWLVPGVNLRSVGTIRDAIKWPKRDKRLGTDLLDSINYNLLSPYTIRRMVNGQKILKNLKMVSARDYESYMWGATHIKKNSLDRGIQLYEMAIIKFLGNSFISRINRCHHCKTFEELKKCLSAKNKIGKGDWIDLAGLIAPKSQIDYLVSKIISGRITALSEIDKFLKQLHLEYYEYEWTWAFELYEEHYNTSFDIITIERLIQLIEDWKKSVVGLDWLLYEDAKKEFALTSMTGFGIDGDQEIKKLDFEGVRGTFKQNAFVSEILSHIQKKTELGNKTIEYIKSLAE
jgi:NDP-sugar pyrophosphorylase family protein